jgi:hypothetical protein
VRRAPALAALAAIACIALPARADDDALRLTWSAPAGCPSSEDVRAASLRGTRGAKEKDASRAANVSEVLEADAQVEQKQANGWLVRLRTRRGATTGEREIEATTCSGVADATALVLALALVPGSLAPAEEASAPPPPPPPEKDVARPRPSGDSSHAVALGASVAGDASTMPAAAVGGSLSLAWTPGRFRLEADGRRWGSQSRTITASDAGARFSMTSIGARGCWAALRTTSFDLSPCAGADVHLVSAPGYGADANYTATARWATVAGGALARVPLASWLALRARVEAFVPLSRPTFVVEGEGPVHRPPTLGAAASFGAEVLFL